MVQGIKPVAGSHEWGVVLCACPHPSHAAPSKGGGYASVKRKRPGMPPAFFTGQACATSGGSRSSAVHQLRLLVPSSRKGKVLLETPQADSV
jgi:hypothetical protein